MPKVDHETLRKVEAALERYKAVVNDHPVLKPNTKNCVTMMPAPSTGCRT